MYNNIVNIFSKIKSLENKTKKIMKYGFISAFIVLILSATILYTYINYYPSPDLYYIGLQVFKIGLIIGISSFVCGFAIDTIKKELIN